MAHLSPRAAPPLPDEEARALAHVLQADKDVTIFVDGTVHRLSPAAVEAVLDLLSRLSRGEGIMVSSVENLLTTSQAAEVGGISNTYLRQLTDAGTIAVQYRGTHRRIRLKDMLGWLATQPNAPGADGLKSADAAANDRP
ncbi:helix-turn-helix domain-containing protein [Paeniglutamicibacter antarcticus]|uniref:Helix-turn-helix domain-containing protein n=1 Tax=Arthrobacter terrae TaxID=2935737 RepID=A0A931CST3_9MICC|nr:helix-turn-helix domain-containing protein [Arthrobacter terrae]MBG0740794.1 helix-turn-helix domain-containing protein [Arthrobacter terrae]